MLHVQSILTALVAQKHDLILPQGALVRHVDHYFSLAICCLCKEARVQKKEEAGDHKYSVDIITLND